MGQSRFADAAREYERLRDTRLESPYLAQPPRHGGADDDPDLPLFHHRVETGLYDRATAQQASALWRAGDAEAVTGLLDAPRPFASLGSRYDKKATSRARSTNCSNCASRTGGFALRSWRGRSNCWKGCSDAGGVAPHNGRMTDRAHAIGEEVWELLRRLVRERLARKPGGHLVEDARARLELRLPLTFHGPEADSARFAERLVRAVDTWIDDAVQHTAAFRPGHAWCHRCASAACEHSLPPSSRHVFIGYAPTGGPRWEDFAQFLLDRRHPQVDRLYEQPPALLTAVQGAAELHGGILDAFRDRTYELLGQVTAGFFAVRAPVEEGRAVVALTVQAAASRSRRGGLQLGLNLLGRTPWGDPLDQLWDREQELPWRGAVRWAQAALSSAATDVGDGRSPRRRPSRGPLEQRVEAILRGLARRLERERRARSRRTRHAESRHRSGERPTPKAFEDARAAAAEAVLVDERNGTRVVLGDRGRTHFFAPDGRLVSSVRYSPDAIQHKLHTERWRQASSQEVQELLARVAQMHDRQ